MSHKRSIFHYVIEANDSMQGKNPKKFSLGYSVYEVTGEDSFEWFQGQITNDLRLVFGDSNFGLLGTCFCNSKGHIQFNGIIARFKEKYPSFYVLVPSNKAHLLEKRVEDFIVTEDVNLVRSNLQASVISTDIENQLPSHLNTTLPFQLVSSLGNSIAVFGKNSFLVLEEITNRSELMESECENAIGTRLSNGFPNSANYSEHVIFPQELGRVFESTHVSYQKGCYLGQEVIMRIHSQGNIQKHWIRITSSKKLTPGQLISNEEGLRVGEVLEVGQISNDSWIGALFAHNSKLGNTSNWKDTSGNSVTVL